MSAAATPSIGLARFSVPVPASAVLLAALGAVDFAWNSQTGMVFTGQARAFLCMIPVLLVGWFYARRFPPMAQMACYVVLWGAFTQVGCVLTYLAASVGMPLADVHFAAWDTAMGFDWVAWVDLIRAHPVANIILALAYNSLLPQILGLVTLLAFVRVEGRNEEFLQLAMISLVVVTAIAALLPAMGPWSHYAHGAQNAEQTAYIADVLAARSELPSSFGAMQGIVTFPSYHTVLAILFIYTCRGMRLWITAPIVVLNLLMLVAIPSEGGHYLSDMIAGAVVVFAAISVTRRFA